MSGLGRAGIDAQRMPSKNFGTAASGGSRVALINRSSPGLMAGGGYMNRNAISLGLHSGVLAPSGFIATRMNYNRGMWASDSRSKATHMVHRIAAYKLSRTGLGVGRNML